MKPDFLQIGFQKCGTTFLARNVYPSNPNICCLQAASIRDLERLLLNKLILPDSLEYDKFAFEEAFFETCKKLFDGKAVNGIMFEPFTFIYRRRFDRKSVIDRIKTILPDIRIITFIRNQKTWLRSHYSQYLKSGGLLSLHDFLECQFNNPSLDSHYIDWYPLISYLYETFNSDNVLVCLYEDLQRSPQKIADKIFSFLNTSSSKISPAVVNPSLSYYSLALRRFFNHFVRFDCGASAYTFDKDLGEAKPFSKFKYSFTYSFYKRGTNIICYKLDKILKLKKKIRLTESQEQKIEAKYGENNTKLSKLLQIDLSSYGYPLL